jgi:hypothetical protein
MTAPVPVRKLHPDGTISVHLLNADGTEPAAGTTEPSTEKYPATRLIDQQYKLNRVVLNKRLPENLHWLSDNYPFLFEEVLCLLESMDSEHSNSMTRLLNHPLVPDRKITESYVLAYYRNLIELTPLLFTLAEDGFILGADDTEAWNLFVSTRTVLGYTVEHPQFKSAMLAVWIMQDVHHPISTPLKSKDNEANLDIITNRFQEVFDARHELRSRRTIDSATIGEMLQQIRPLRTGAL